jgi:hypothetical protein
VLKCKYFVVTADKKKHVNRRAPFQYYRGASCHLLFIFLQGNAPKETHVIPIETLGKHAQSCATVKSWVAQFNPLAPEFSFKF